ncbi:MAG: MFS transporter [Chloroflexi bacterium]|jgi:MFS family permease|nr:MFS transporter [Chloroflexota bacterium]
MSLKSKISPTSPWRIILPTGIGTAFSLVGDSALYTVLPTHTAVAGVALVSVGVLLSANRFIRLLANPVAGWVSDRRAKRTVFVLSLFLGAFSTAVYGLTTGFWPLLIGRLLWGIAWSGIWVAGNGLILESAPVADRGHWVGRYHLFFFLGAALGAYLGGYLSDRFGFNQAMQVATLLGLAGALIAWLLLPSSRQPVIIEEDPPEEDQQQTSPDQRRKTRWGELLSASAVTGVNRLVVAGILTSTFALFLKAMLGDSIEIGDRLVGVSTVTGLLVGTRILLGMLFTPLLGSLSDRAANRWRVVAGGLLPGIAGFMLLAVNLPLAMLLGLPLTAITGSSNQVLSTALIGDLGQRQRHGRYLGLLYTIGDLGSAIGPPLAFALLPIWGISGLYWLNAFLFALLLLVSLRWVRKRRTINALQE